MEFTEITKKYQSIPLSLRCQGRLRGGKTSGESAFGGDDGKDGGGTPMTWTIVANSTFGSDSNGENINALAWQNQRGILGQWSEYKSAIIP